MELPKIVTQQPCPSMGSNSDFDVQFSFMFTHKPQSLNVLRELDASENQWIMSNKHVSFIMIST